MNIPSETVLEVLSLTHPSPLIVGERLGKSREGILKSLTMLGVPVSNKKNN